MKIPEVFFGPNLPELLGPRGISLRPQKFQETRGSMYGISTYIYHRNQPNVGKYTIHGYMGPHIPIHSLPNPTASNLQNPLELWEVLWVPMTEPWISMVYFAYLFTIKIKYS